MVFAVFGKNAVMLLRLAVVVRCESVPEIDGRAQSEKGMEAETR